MEVPLVTSELDNEDKALNSLPDKFDSAMSLENTSSSCSLSKASQDADMNEKEVFKHERSSEPITDRDKDKSCYAQKKSPNASILKKTTSTDNNSSVFGKNMVWRIAGSNKISEGSTPLEVESTAITRSCNGHRENHAGHIVGSNETPERSSSTRSSDCNGHRENHVWRIVGSNETPSGGSSSTINSSSNGHMENRVCLPDKFDSALSLENTSSSCSLSKASQNADMNEEEVFKYESSSEPVTDRDKDKSCYAHKKSPNASILKKTTSTDNNSSVGKNMVWRIAGSNNISEGSTPLEVESTSIARSCNGYRENHAGHIVGSNETPSERSSSTRSSSCNGHRENRVWRIVGSNETPSERSSSTRNTSSNDDMEMFLFEMVGRGFQVDRSTIREVLSNCGYDMKKSMEALLELSAVQLDRRNNSSEGTHLHSNRKSYSYENQKQNKNSAERTNSVPSRLGSLTQPFDALKQPDLTVSAPVPKTIAENFKEEATCPDFDDMKDDAEEGSYYALRKSVKEHRETMKQYYEAAAEAFAMGDRGRAVSLLEKGQVFYNKAREVHEESFPKIFETSSGSGDDNGKDGLSLKLQDYEPKEAIRLLKTHLRSLSGIPLVQDLKINVGNDDQHAEKRKRLILRLLDKEGIKWIEDENSGAILVRLDEINPKNLSFGK